MTEYPTGTSQKGRMSDGLETRTVDEKVDAGFEFLQQRSKRYRFLLFSFTGDRRDRDIEVEIHSSPGSNQVLFILLMFLRDQSRLITASTTDLRT